MAAPDRGPGPARPEWRPSARDLEILRLMVDGLTIEAVARRLRVSDRTVRRRLQASADELGVGSTLQVVVEAVRRRLV